MELVGGTIALLIYIVAIVLIFKFVKSAVKTILIGLLIIVLVLGFSGFYIYKDAADLKENFANSSKMVLLEDNGTILTGFEMMSFDNVTFYTRDDLDNISEAFREGDYDDIIGDNYKIIIMEIEAFDEILTEDIDFDGTTIEGSLINETLHSDNPLDILDELYLKSVPEAAREQARAQMEKELDGEQLKAAFFGVLIKQKVEEGFPEIVGEMRNETIIVYPETAVFTAIKFAPSTIIDDIKIT